MGDRPDLRGRPAHQGRRVPRDRPAHQALRGLRGRPGRVARLVRSLRQVRGVRRRQGHPGRPDAAGGLADAPRAEAASLAGARPDVEEW